MFKHHKMFYRVNFIVGRYYSTSPLYFHRTLFVTCFTLIAIITLVISGWLSLYHYHDYFLRVQEKEHGIELIPDTKLGIDVSPVLIHLLMYICD